MNVLSHLLERRLEPALYNGLAIDDARQVATFALWNLAGQWVGYQQYRPHAPKSQRNDQLRGRYYTYMSGADNTAFGLELVNPRQRVIFLVEGVFDAAPFHRLGANALALLGSSPWNKRSWLHSLGYGLVVVADGDKAGAKMVRMGHEAVFLSDGVDAGDMSDADLMAIIDRYA